MLTPSSQSSSRDYAGPVTLLAVALIFVPVFAGISRPLGTASIWAAFGTSVLCMCLAWIYWKRSPTVAYPLTATLSSIATRRTTPSKDRPTQ